MTARRPTRGDDQEPIKELNRLRVFVGFLVAALWGLSVGRSIFDVAYVTPAWVNYTMAAVTGLLFGPSIGRRRQ